MYIENTAPTGSVIAASGQTYLVIVRCSITSNTANSAIIYVGAIASVHMRDTEFMNNTSELPTVYVINSVNSFSCFRCTIQQNIATVEGIFSITYADQVT